MAPGAGYGMTRGWIAVGAVSLALLASPAAALAGATPSAHAASRTATSILHTTVPTKGKYRLIVWVRSRGKHSRLVDVYVAGQPMKSVVANPWWGAAVYYTLSLSPTKLSVRTVNAPPAVQVRATLSLRKASPSSASASPTKTTPPASNAGGSSSGSGSGAGGSSSSGTSSTPPAPTPPQAPNPYTTLTFSDNFQQDFTAGASAPNQYPNPSTWNLDNWGSCGTGTLSTSNTNDPGVGQDLDGVNPDENVHLSSNGLAITAIPNPEGSGYVAAQVDSAPDGSSHPGFSDAYGAVEASIEMPAGQGLCAGFWMLGDNDIPGTSIPGEIDIVEAPTFGGGLGDPTYFDLHGSSVGGTTQAFSTYSNAIGDPSAGFHTYAVIWTPTSITWTIDGVAYASADQASLVAGASWAQDFNTSPFHMLFSLSVGGWPCYGGTCTPQTTPADYTMYIQWVKWFT